jgi:tetratricopeptide (TPR) repeat protein
MVRAEGIGHQLPERREVNGDRSATTRNSVHHPLTISTAAIALLVLVATPVDAQAPKPKPKPDDPAPVARERSAPLPATLLVVVDAPATVSVDGKEIGSVTPGAPRVVPIRLGEHLVGARSGDAHVESVVDVKSGAQRIVSLPLAAEISRHEEASRRSAEQLQQQVAEAEKLIETADYANAEVVLRRAIAQNPRKPEWQARLVDVLTYADKMTEAEAQARELIKVSPRSGWSHHSLAMVAWRLDRMPEAERELAEALRLEPRADWYEQHARLLWGAGRVKDAESELRSALRLDPSSIETHGTLASLLKQQRRWSEAEGEYRAAAALDVKEDSLLLYRHELVMFLFTEDRWSDARNELIQVLEHLKGLQLEMVGPDFRARLAQACEKLQAWTEAEAAYRANGAFSRYDLSRFLSRRGRFADAEAAARQALAEYAQSSYGHVALGVALAGQGKTAEAEEEYRIALGFATDAAAQNDVTYMMVSDDIMVPEAVRMLERIVAANPGVGAYEDSLAWAYYKAGRFEDAERHAMRSMELKNETPETLQHVGDIKSRLGKAAEARTYWERALESLYPESRSAAALRAKIAAAR